jgi:hypothetical protein
VREFRIKETPQERSHGGKGLSSWRRRIQMALNTGVMLRLGFQVVAGLALMYMLKGACALSAAQEQ